MKLNVLGWGVLISSACSISSGLYLYIEGKKIQRMSIPKAQQILRDETRLSRAHPKPSLPSVVRPVKETIVMRAGPSDQFPVTGTLSLTDEYEVTDWHGDWFKITSAKNPGITAWVQNDQLR